jgi:hypothetical protein
MRWQRSFRPEPTPPEIQRVGFAPVIVAAGAEPVIVCGSGKRADVNIVGKDRQVIVDTGVDAAALFQVLQVLERR